MKKEKYTRGACMNPGIRFWGIICLLFFSGFNNSTAQRNSAQSITEKNDLRKIKNAVEKYPDSLMLHQEYIKAVGLDDPQLEIQYAEWIKQFPRSAIVPFAIGNAFQKKESPKAKPYLLKTVELDPGFTEGWGGLWIDAERWGDFAGGRDHLAKATASDPSNPNYAFYYASSFENIDWEEYVNLSLDVVKRFPENERGAQALYWLAVRSKNTPDKITYFELLRKSYSADKFRWTKSGMSSYFDLLLSERPEKALELSREVSGMKGLEEEWKRWKETARLVVDANNLMVPGKSMQALELLKTVKVPRYFSFNKTLVLLQAKANALAGNIRGAYDSLVVDFTKNPNNHFKSAILQYGAQINKNESQIEVDIWKQLTGNAKPATPFSLKTYDSEGNLSLTDFKGKVVLLTYWFPGCGPCRGEFPHFQNVVNRFDEKDLAYVGINIVSDQNDYVLPFLKTSGYSFIPLEDFPERKKGNLDNGGAAPVNFLIDKEGQVVFSNFRTDGHNEDELELMINLLLAERVLEK